MDEAYFREAAGQIREDLRLKTFPVAVGFPRDKADIPEKARRPSIGMGKRIAVCQGVTMARNYGWTIALAREDIQCVPAAIVFGFSDSPDPAASLAELFREIEFSSTEELARKETASMSRFENGEIAAVVLAPLHKAAFEPDTILVYGTPAQTMRLAQAWSYATGRRLSGEAGGKVECDEYLIAPFKTQSARMVIPGNGERIFAGTQDDEMVFAVPSRFLGDLVAGLHKVGRAIGVRLPVTPYQNFQPEFPEAHRRMGKKLGIL